MWWIENWQIEHVVESNMDIDMNSIVYKQTNSQMDKLIAEIYATFSIYTIDEVKGVCTECCLSQKSIDEILSVPLNELSWYAVYEYLDAAKYDVEILVAEAKYLLPRIIELFTLNEYVRQPSEQTFETCHFDRPELWNTAELQLIEQFATLHFKKVIIENDEDFTLDELIIMWQMAGLDIDFLFDSWAQAIDYPKALDDYAEMLSFNFKDLNYEPTYISYALAKRFTDWALSNKIVTAFLNKTYLALKNIDLLDKYQLSNYEYVLQLAE